MSKTANPTLVGSFVIGAIALVLGAIIVLGNFTLQDKILKSVLYFSGSLHGLDVGAPVTLRGVQVGRVTSIRIDFDRRQTNYTIPVYICLEGRKDEGEEFEQWDQQAVEQTMRQMIEKGLKAQLKLRSLITGKLYIDLAFYPEAPANFLHKSQDIIEIPTMPSGLEQFTQVITDLPLHEIITKVNSALDSINNLLSSNQSEETIAAVNSSAKKLDAILDDVRKELPLLSSQIKDTLQAATEFSASGTSLLQSTDRNLAPVLQAMRKTLGNVDGTLDELSRTLNNISALVDENSNIPYDFAMTVRDIQAAAQSVKRLSEELQRHPDALLFGRRESTSR